MTRTFDVVLRLRHVLFVAVAILTVCTDALPVVSKALSITSRASLAANSGYVQAKRHLRTHKSSMRDEDRAFGFNFPVISELADKLLKKPKNEEEVLQLFLKLKVPNQKTQLFENPQFQKLVRLVTTGYKANSEAGDRAMSSILAAKIGDEPLAKMLMEAKVVPSTENIAARLEKAQLKNWQFNGKSPDELLRVLALEHDGYISLSKPLINAWVSYVEMINENPYKLLLARMRALQSDDQVAISLGEAGGSTIAQRVEDLLLDSWVPQSVDDIFKLLKLDTAGKHVFNYPRLSTWIAYVTKVEGKRADEKMYSVLRGAYGDDELAVMLAGSKKYLAGDIAKRLEEIQHAAMLSGGKNAEAMFTTLKLNTHGDQLFESPAFSSWASYVIKLDAENADSLMLSALKANYDEDVLAKMILAAKGNADTRSIAGKLEQVQMKDWLDTEKTADNVFKLLNLDADVNTVLTNPLLSYWMTYAEKLDENPYSARLTQLKTFKTTNSDGMLVDLLMKAKAETKTSVIAGKLEAVQLERWQSDGKTAADVFKMLDLDKQGTYILYEWNVRAWLTYVAKVDAKTADDTIASVLNLHYTDDELVRVVSHGQTESADLAAIFEKIILNKWLREKKSADDNLLAKPSISYSNAYYCQWCRSQSKAFSK